MNVYSLYTDEDAVGMDHPLFMAKTQAGLDAGLAAAIGVPLKEALGVIRSRMQALFGDIPLALVDTTVSMAYARYEADEADMVPPAVD